MRYRTHVRLLGDFVNPYIPDAETNGGLGIRYVGDGAVAMVPIHLPPWQPYANGDIVELLWDGNRLDRRFMNPQDSDKVLQFDIEPNEIRQYGDGEHLLVARLTLGISGDTKESDPIPVWVKTTWPGGIDTQPDTTTINENLAVPTVRPDPPTDDLDNVRVAFPMYENAAVGDRITVSWQGRFIPVPPAQPVPLTEADLAKTEFEIAVPRAVIEGAGGGDEVPISYRIIDRVSNSSLWAPYLRQKVPIEDPNAPPAPWVEGTVDDDGAVLRLVDLGNGPVSVMVEAGHGGKKGETIHVHWAGTAADARPVPAYDTNPQLLSRDNGTLSFSVPYDQARILGEGSVEVTYVIHHANGTTTTSRRRTLTVEGEAVGLLPPFVINTPGDILDAAQHKSGALMVAPLQPERVPSGSQVTFTWAGVDSGSTESFANDSEDTYGLMPYSNIQALVGTTVRIRYQVDDFNVDTRPDAGYVAPGVLTVSDSEWITLNVIDSDAATPDLPPPFVPEAVNDILDPGALLAHLQIPAPTPARATQVTARIDARVPFTQTLAIRNPSSPPSFQLMGNTFIKPNDGSNAVATYTVTGGDGYVAYSRPYAFTIGNVVPELPPPTVDEAVGSSLDPIKATDGVTVRVPADLQTGDSVVVHFGTWSSASMRWSANMGVPVPAGEVARWLGKGVDVTYTVNGETDSPPLTLNVKPIKDHDQDVLPTPTFKELVDDVLDVSKTATLHVDPWPLMAVGQKVWCTVHGEDTNGRPTTTTIWTSAAVIERELREGCNKVVSEAWLKTLKDGSDITIAFAVTFDQSDVSSNAIAFPVKPYRIKSLADFVLDPSEMKLDIGRTATRTPTGGQPPYRYASNATSVATVTDAGIVTGVRPGTATITVSDSSTPANQRTYKVEVSVPASDIETFDGYSLRKEGVWYIGRVGMYLGGSNGGVAPNPGYQGFSGNCFRSGRETVLTWTEIQRGTTLGAPLLIRNASFNVAGTIRRIALIDSRKQSIPDDLVRLTYNGTLVTIEGLGTDIREIEVSVLNADNIYIDNVQFWD